MSGSQDTTHLLLAAREGDRDAFDLLYQRLYGELRQIARQRLRRNRPGETLNTTALVHEAYLRLVDQESGRPGDRAHFMALASRAMRFILVDHVRSGRKQKRGGGQEVLPLDEVRVGAEVHRADELLALDRALESLSERSARQGQLVEYRFFGGLTYEEIAEVMGLSVRTVKREWTKARTWLHAFMEPERV
jgi:RNA polymerase sigma factor (TIGR02999 family)